MTGGSAVKTHDGAASTRGQRARRFRGLLAMMVGSGLLFVGLIGSPGQAGAESALLSYGWWYLPNQVPDAAAAPPAPPWVPSDGMYVAGAEAGPVALAAVKLVSDGKVTLSLNLTPNGQAGLPSVAACVVLTNWDGASSGRWEGRPAYDCANEVVGQVSEDGGKMLFALDPNLHQENGAYNVALVPTGLVPFSATFDAPGDKSLLVTGGSVGAPASEDPEAATDSDSNTFGSGSSFDPGAFTGSDESFTAFDEPEVPTGPAAAPAPGVPLAPTTGLTEAFDLPDDRNQRIAAVAGLGLLAIGAWLFGGRTARPPRLLGSMADRTGS